jgi:hypothetical protein
MDILAYFPMSSDLFCIEEGRETHDPFYEAHPATLFSFFFEVKERQSNYMVIFFKTNMVLCLKRKLEKRKISTLSVLKNQQRK